MPRPLLIVHGGAGTIPEERHAAAVEGCRRAARAGWSVLAAGGSALDAVEAAVRALEDDPTFNAGRGSVMTRAGTVEMDALIMDGVTLRAGAVAAVRRVCNPIALARAVMERTPHVLLVGAGAEALAALLGLPMADDAELVAPRDRERWEALQRNGPPDLREVLTQALAEPMDTVGAVALDTAGHIAAAVSTGGMSNKWPGRVGDSALVGCGAYADDRIGAAVATGWGETLMRVVISKTACDFMALGLTAQAAVEAALHVLEERVQGRGGLIGVDRMGRIGIAHNTPHMAWAWTDGEALEAGIRSPDP
ncbi:Isoaspartyl peptidase [Candidatus Thermoflexus japonica]|uniref:Isoaspartyl peptidase n=1 Tax=Candidatus Thermoflexus japonica TaxID=2035417 RepID=A0A2H5Y7C0_9CHLR|nr:Isoaspartyl peptidase [Candidatus Thermoflexus japonica]